MPDPGVLATAAIVVGLAVVGLLLWRWRRATRATRACQLEHYQVFYGGTVDGLRARVDVPALTALKRERGGMAVVIAVRDQDPQLPLDVTGELAKSL